MNSRILQLIYVGLVILSVTACRQSQDQTAGEAKAEPIARKFAAQDGGLSDYWYQGEAEISSYELSQNRYADTHPGEAVMIFVTEDFLTGKQVKDEFPLTTNSIKVLKNNQLRKFPTGIYDYSMMTSVFTPVRASEFPYTLKVSTSSQEWCGHTYMQINKEKRRYRMRLHSYFEEEADQMTEAPLAILEDELYNRIRINPEGLPTGELELFPGTMYCRLTHTPFEAQPATATLDAYEGNTFEGEKLRAYRLSYPDQRRTLEIVFEAEPPYIIVGWTDTYPSLFDGALRTTIAKRKRTLLDPYWKHNSLKDMSLRQKLKIEGI
jgi:hypothetical protein